MEVNGKLKKINLKCAEKLYKSQNRNLQKMPEPLPNSLQQTLSLLMPKLRRLPDKSLISNTGVATLWNIPE